MGIEQRGSERALGWRDVLRRLFALAFAGMHAYWTSDTAPRHCWA